MTIVTPDRRTIEKKLAEFIAEQRARRPTGTFACPICGNDKPHHHTAEVVDAYRTKGTRNGR